VTDGDWQSTGAWRDLLAGMGEVDRAFLEGPRALKDGRSVAEGYRALATALGVALDAYLYGDPERPIFLDVNTPYRRDRSWGGDNTDAYYAFTRIDPTRTYRVTGQCGDSAYFSITVYNEPSPGAWSDAVVGVVNDTDLGVDGDGRFSLVMGPGRPMGYTGPFIGFTPDASVAFTRDYQVDPIAGRRVEWDIECLDEPGTPTTTDRDTAVALRTALTWVRTMFDIVPVTLAARADDVALGHRAPAVANVFADPYQVQDANYGWSARDACYGFATFAIEADEALVVTHRPPACRFWNVIVWNQYMAGHTVKDPRTSVNNGSAVPNTDGTVTVVIGRDLLAHPNAITTIDHARGMIAFRWFLADNVPGRPTVDVVKIADAPTSTT
jgi:hypothetical protein